LTVQGLAAVAAALVALLPPAARGDSLACAGGIVSAGDSKVDLLGKCGRPALEDVRREDSALLRSGGAARRVSAPVERWTYDFGRNRFVQVVTLVAGKVTAVERGSYGFADRPATPERPRRATCDPAALAVGKLELEILARCGEPAAVDAWEEELRVAEKVGHDVVAARSVVVTVERWTYDFGRNQLLRFVRIADGKVTLVETGSYGYAE
jgi:hypothetical protein